MTTKIVCKETFAVIGKAGQGPANNAAWIPPLWDDAGGHYDEIANAVCKDGKGDAYWWGAMNDETDSNKRWGETGKYMAGCEAEVDAIPPTDWTKWIIPAQTYLVAECTPSKYGEVFREITSDPKIDIVAE